MDLPHAQSTVMCHCLSFLFHPTQSWDSWRRAFLRLIRKVRSYKGPFTGLEVRSLNETGTLTDYSASGKRKEVVSLDPDLNLITWNTGGCASSNSKPPFAKCKQITSKDAAPTLARQTRRVKSIEAEQKDGSACTYDSPSPRWIGMNGATKVACLFTQQGRKGLNQDAMVVCEDFGSQKNAVLCGVFDGHGPYGHLVAQRVRDLLPSKLASNWKLSSDTGKEESPIMSAASNYMEDSAKKGCLKPTSDTDVDSRLLPEWKESFLNACMVMDKELLETRSIDCCCSGTTAVTLVKQGNDVIIGNVGDSRAVLATKCDESSLRPVQLTVDLKPNLPEEAERIKQCKGRVFALQDELEVPRVWLPDDDSPGLSMTRAFGDSCLKKCGVIAVPDVTYHRLTERDQFIVLATDGVWDVLSNEQVVKIVSSSPSRSLAAETVVKKAVRAWRTEHTSSQIDDCAVVCLFLQDILTICSDSVSTKQRMLSSSLTKQYTSHAQSQNSGEKELLDIKLIHKKVQVSVCPNVKDSGTVSQDHSFQNNSLNSYPCQWQ